MKTHSIEIQKVTEESRYSWVSAEIWEDITDKNIRDSENEWTEGYVSLMEDKEGEKPDGKPWSWARFNTTYTADCYKKFSIVAENMTQSMMLVEICLDDVYICHLASAPWNNRLKKDRKYRGVGKLLIATAVRLSERLNKVGRIRLHSLERAEKFYEGLGMQHNWHKDDSEGLKCFELDSEGAKQLLFDENSDNN